MKVAFCDSEMLLVSNFAPGDWRLVANTACQRPSVAFCVIDTAFLRFAAPTASIIMSPNVPCESMRCSANKLGICVVVASHIYV